jgi:hypothetical protein
MRMRRVTETAPLRCEPFAGTLDEWGEVLERFPDREIFQTPAWIRFLAESQGGEPVCLVLKSGDETVGYFAGLIIRRLGLKILGSPFIGWTTERMGVRLLPGVSHRAAVVAVARYAFKNLGCIHFELSDRNISPNEIAGLGFQRALYETYVVDLTPDEDQLFHNMNGSARRYCNRKGPKRGVTVEEARDEEFADDYYAQLCDVFAKQSLVPTYGVDRVRLLVRHLLPTGNLLCLRARDADGRCIATGIFMGMNRYAYFWGNASWRQHQRLRPNEPLHWHAMCYWKRKGMQSYDMCGGGLYKLKYGGQLVQGYRLWKPRYAWIGWARRLAEKGYYSYRRVAGLGRGQRNDVSAGEDV